MERRRILIADDHLDMLERARALLAPEFDVIAMVSDGQAAVETTARLRPELAVLDISMPVLNGLDAAVRIANLPQAPRTVFLSVYDDPEFVEAARLAGGSAYVLKRSMAVDLVPAVRRALGVLPPDAKESKF